MWFTNVDVDKRHDNLVLYRKYNQEDYPKYVNYDAIEVSKTSNIPCDYDGLMGVPITFMDKYNPEQFEIIGSSLQVANPIAECVPPDKRYVKGGPCFYLIDESGRYDYKRIYDRIVIRRRQARNED